MNIVLTNDDGYDSPGIQALASRLSEQASVTIVAPESDQSAMGRVYTGEFTLTERERGYAVSGTPVDCIVAAVEGLDLAPDLIVSGCNTGANLGGHILGRSGTISAAVEASFFDLPAIAVSLHVPDNLWPLDATLEHFDAAAEVTSYLVRETGDSAIFDTVGYLNVNIPFEVDLPVAMRVTRPSDHYDMMAIRDGSTITIQDRTWDEFGELPTDQSADTDRGAIAQGLVSVSPLCAPHACPTAEELEAIAQGFHRAEQMVDRSD